MDGGRPKVVADGRGKRRTAGSAGGGPRKVEGG